MNWPIPNPFTLVSVDAFPVPNGFAFLFEPIPTIFIVAGLVFGGVRHYRQKARLMGLALASLCLLFTGVATAQFADRYTLTYSADAGCPTAPQGGKVALVPLFTPEAYRRFLPENGGFDALHCEEFETITENHAPGGLFASAMLLAFGLALLCFCIGAIFAWLVPGLMRLAPAGPAKREKAAAPSPRKRKLAREPVAPPQRTVEDVLVAKPHSDKHASDGPNPGDGSAATGQTEEA